MRPSWPAPEGPALPARAEMTEAQSPSTVTNARMSQPRVSAATAIAPSVARGLSMTAEGLYKRFGTVQALTGLSLEARAGEALGLLGPNGAGKTTFMHMMAGVTRPDAGHIQVGQMGPPTRRRVRRLLGIAPQAVALYPRLTAAENLRFFGQLYGVPRAELKDRVEQGLALAHLQSRRDHRAGTFSGGMQRRLNLACAVIHQPQVLLLDEPTAGVDPQSRTHIFVSIANLRNQGLTIICSTHLLEEAQRLCDRVAIVDGGRVQALDSTTALIERYGAADLEEVFLELTGKELRDQ